MSCLKKGRRGAITSDAEVVKLGWEAVARADWDTVLAYFTDDIILVMPGQNDVLEGKVAIRNAFENIGAALPPGFEITAIREIGETGEVVSVVDWKSDKLPEGSQFSVLFRFTEGKIFEERWFLDTEQWKAAF